MGKESKNNNIDPDEVNVFKEIFIKGQVYKDVLSKKDLWKDLAKLFSGKFRIKQTISRDINSFQLEIPYQNHLLRLTESDTKPLKFEIELKLNRNFEFNISWEDNIERIFKLFGRQDIKIGNEEFDKKYLIQSNNPELMLKILSFEEVGKTVLKNNIFLLALEYDSKKEIHRLLTVKDRNTKSKEILIELINMEFTLIDLFTKENMLRSYF